MNCIIIEDQPPAQRILKKYIEDIGTLELKGTFVDAIAAMVFLKQENVDLIFLDIHLPKISGMDFLKTVQNPPHIILTTAFSDYALESYEFNVVDYLLKPFSFQRFVKAVSKIPIPTLIQETEKVSSVDHTIPQKLFIKSGHEYIQVNLDDILYIQSDTDYTMLVLPHKKVLTTESLRYWLGILDTSQFTRIHKSYIVHIDKIKKISGGQIYMQDGLVIPIGRAYKEGFVQRFL